MNAFAGSITCIYCRQHFGQMFGDYQSKVPNWADSRKDLFVAICRMHNAVNKRLDKPQPKTVAECIAALKLATTYTSPREFRAKYSDYLLRDWGWQRNGGDGFLGYKNAEVVKKINEEYWNHRDVSYAAISFEEDNVLDYSKVFKSEKPVIPKFNLAALLGKRW